jgi:hypothetical protein
MRCRRPRWSRAGSRRPRPGARSIAITRSYPPSTQDGGRRPRIRTSRRSPVARSPRAIPSWPPSTPSRSARPARSTSTSPPGRKLATPSARCAGGRPGRRWSSRAALR